MSRLKKLNLSANQLTFVPEGISQLTELEVLNLNRNQLSDIPEELTTLKNLKEVAISYNQLKEFPSCMLAMDKLESISMDTNQLSELPENLHILKQLKSFYCAHNQVRRLPSSLQACQKLQTLDLSGNPLEEEGFLELWMSMPWCRFVVAGTSIQGIISKREEERKRGAVMNQFTGWEQIEMKEPPLGMETYWFGRRSQKETPHRIGPDPSEIFSEKINPKKLIPFLTVDLHAMRPEWQGKAHFLAWDYSLEYLTFQLKEDKYKFLKAGSLEINSLTKLFRNLDDIEDLNPKEINWNEAKNSFFKGEYYTLEPFHLPSRRDTKRDREWLNNSYTVLKNDPRRFLLFRQMPMSDGSEVMIELEKQMFLAPEPIWLQNDATPVDPDGKVMDFVGQINPSEISKDLPDGRVYLFYSQKHQIVTLVGQCT